MPTETRWALPTSSSHRSLPSASPADRMRVCDLIPDIEDKRDPRTGRRGIDNFASFMKFLAPVGRGPIGEAAQDGRTGVRRDRLRRVPRTVHADRTERQPALPPSSGPVVLGPAAARHRYWRWHRAGCRRHPKRFARRRCGGSGSAGRSCTTAPRQRSRKPSAATRNEAELARRGYERAAESDRAALLAFLRSL